MISAEESEPASIILPIASGFFLQASHAIFEECRRLTHDILLLLLLLRRLLVNFAVIEFAQDSTCADRILFYVSTPLLLSVLPYFIQM